MTQSLKELVRLASSQPVGPWMPVSDWNRYAVMQQNHPHERVVCTVNQCPISIQGRKADPLEYVGTAKSTAEFIAAARNSIPAIQSLLTLTEELEGLLKRWRVEAGSSQFSAGQQKCADELQSLINERSGK